MKSAPRALSVCHMPRLKLDQMTEPTKTIERLKGTDFFIIATSFNQN